MAGPAGPFRRAASPASGTTLVGRLVSRPAVHRAGRTRGLAAGALPVLLNHRQAIDYADEAKFRGHFDVLIQVIAERTGAGVPDANILDSPFFSLLKKADPLRSPPVPGEGIG